MVEWIIANKEWFLSGVGGGILTIVAGLFMRSGSQLKQSQKSGNNSTS